MRIHKITKFTTAMLILLLAAASYAVDPTYQPIPANVTASGVADTSGTGGFAYVEYWVWNGGNGYYYYTYRIHNEAFSPFIKHLTIGNPTAEPYVVTGSSGGGTVGGTPWSYATHASLPTVVDWVASDPATVIYPGQNSWETQLFQFASKLPPSSAALTIREGDLSIYANGLIPAPGNSSYPRSSGYWKHQFTGKGQPKETAMLPNYLKSIEIYSDVLAGGLAGTISSDLAFGTSVLVVEDSSVMLDKAKKELLALWLNVVSQKLDYYAAVKFTNAAVTTTAATIGQAIDQIESTIINQASDPAALENVKDMAEYLNNM